MGNSDHVSGATFQLVTPYRYQYKDVNVRRNRRLTIVTLPLAIFFLLWCLYLPWDTYHPFVSIFLAYGFGFLNLRSANKLIRYKRLEYSDYLTSMPITERDLFLITKSPEYCADTKEYVQFHLDFRCAGWSIRHSDLWT